MKPNKNSNNNGNKRRWIGVVTIILWAIVMTLLFNAAASAFKSANTVEVPYSTFRTWIKEDKVQSVAMENNKFTITLKAGADADLPEENDSTADLFGALFGTSVPSGARLC